MFHLTPSALTGPLAQQRTNFAPFGGLRAFFFSLALLLLLVGDARGDERPLPVYSYHGSRLYLMINAPSGERAVIRWRAVNSRGAPVGRTRRKKVKLSSGKNKIELLVGDAGGHHLEFKVGGAKHRVWANRGVWYVAPTPLRVSKTIYTRGRSSAMMIASDLLFAGGMKARAVTADGESPLEIGRTLGYDTDYGLRVEPRQALVVVARGNVGPVKVTVAQRLGRKKLQYWDYSLRLGDRLKRYVIPFGKLRPREGTPRPFKAIFAISLQSTNPVAQGGSLAVDYLGFTRRSLAVKRARRIARGVRVDLAGDRKSEAELWVSWGSGEPVRHALGRKKTTLVKEHDARQFWICYLAPDGSHGCDPPDAPATAYALPRTRGTPLLIDDFSHRAPINYLRAPTEVFASSVAHQQKMLVQRRKGALLLRYHPKVSGDYAGYKTPLPVPLPRDLHTVELKIRGEVSPATVTVGLRDVHGREPRVALSSYTEQLGNKWRTVYIPIEAFQAMISGFKHGPRRLGTLRSLSVTMGVSTTPAVHQLELKSVRLLPIKVPLAIVRFDGERSYRSALGGGLLMESRHGAKILGDLTRPGKVGQAMLLKVSSVTERGYALVALGLGRVDARAYSRLRFWVKLQSRTLNAVLYISDGKRKARVELAKLVKSIRGWQPVSIPLNKLEPRVDLSRLRQVILAWEEQTLAKESVAVDEFFFE